MNLTTLCRLCISSCNTFKCLYDDNGQLNKVYDMAAKYFDPMLLQPGKNFSSVICIECWNHITEFYKFQQSVISSQTQLEHVKHIVLIIELEDQLIDRVMVTQKVDDFNNVSENAFHQEALFDIVARDDEIYIEHDGEDTILDTEIPDYNNDGNLTPAKYNAAIGAYDALITKWKEKLGCIVCHKTFATYTLLSNHFRIKHPGNEFYIHCCNHNFNNKHKLMMHLRQFHNSSDGYAAHECELCTSSFSQISFLSRHYRHVHNRIDGNNFNCETCGKSFAQSLNLRKHILLSHKDQPLPQWFCPQCNRMFKYRTNLEKHKEQVHSRIELNDDLPIKNIKNHYLPINNIKNEQQEELIGNKPNIIASTSSAANLNDDKIPQVTFERTFETNVQLNSDFIEDLPLSHIKNEQQSEGKCVHKQNKISCNYIDSNKDGKGIHELKLGNTEENDQEIIDNREIPIQQPAVDVNYMQLEMSLNYDNVSDIEQSDYNLTHFKNSNDMADDFVTKNSTSRKEKEMEYDAFVAKHKGDLECPLCKETYANFSLLNQHFRRDHTGEKSFVMCCQLKLVNRFRICEHLRYHIDPKAYQCDVCEKCFKNTGSLVLHKQLVHIENQSSQYRHYLCQCKKSKDLYAQYVKETDIKLDEASTSKDPEHFSRDILNKKYYKTICCQLKQRMLRNDATIAKCRSELCCRICKAKFSFYSLLRDHFCCQHPQDNFYITCCQGKFFKLVDLLDHIRIHLTSNEFKCEICNKLLAGKKSLKKHMSLKHKDLPSSLAFSTVSKNEQTNLDNEECYTTDEMRANRVIPMPALVYFHTDNTNSSMTKSIESNDISDKIDSSDKRRRLQFDEYISKWKGDLKCVICEEAFVTYSLLRKHFSSKHPEQECHIICCDRKIVKRCKVVEHIRKYHNRIKNLHKCKICSASFPQYIKLRRHYLQVHNPKDNYAYKCEICGAAFMQGGTLKKHIIHRHSEQPTTQWFCQECNRMFKFRLSMENHMKKMHKNLLSISPARNSCKETDKTITITQEIPCSSIAITNEIQMPTLDIVDIKPEISFPDKEWNATEQSGLEAGEINKTDNMEDDYFAITSNPNKDLMPLLYDDFIEKWKGDLECPKCNAVFIKYTLLSEHFQLEHPKARCYIICCETVFIKIDDIVQHLRTHVDRKAYQCEICGRSYKNARSLVRHKTDYHTNLRSTSRLYICHCNKAMQLYAEKETSYNPTEVETINVGSTSEPLNYQYDSIICCQRKQRMLSNDDIIAKWMPQLECRICKVKLTYYSLLRAHFDYKHPQEKCYIICCQRNFYKTLDAIEHIRIHLDPFAFKCEICNIPLSGKSSLTRHMREIHDETGSKQKWSCDQCNKTFKQRYTLTKHMRSEHPNKVK